MNRFLHSLKVLLVVLLSFFSSEVAGQVTIFSENMGTVNTTQSISANIFQNSATLSFNGTADTRATGTLSNNYTGASASKHIYVANTTGTYFTISGINTSSHNGLSLSFGLMKSTNADLLSSGFVVEVATDYNKTTNTGTFTQLSYTNITTSMNVWSLISPTGTIPSSSNLAIRFRQNQTTSQVRIDDVKLTGILAATPVIALSDNGTPTAAGNMMQGVTNHILSTFKLDVTSANASLTEARFLLTGDYQPSDITNFKLWHNTTNSFTGATQLASKAPASTGLGEVLAFTGLSRALNIGTGYFWVTADVTAAATTGKTVKTEVINNTDIIFASGTKSGSASAAGVQTITVNTSPSFLIEDKANLNFGSSCINTTSSTAGSFTLYGFNLSGNATVGPLAGYTFSKDGITYTNSLTLVPDGTGAITEVINIHFTPTLAQAYNGNVPVSGGGAATATVAVTGTGTHTNPTVTSSAATLVGNTKATLQGNVTNVGSCPVISEKGFVYAKKADHAVPAVGDINAVKIAGTGAAVGAYNQQVTGLSLQTAYVYRAYVYDGTTYYYSTTTQEFTTLSAATKLVYKSGALPPTAGNTNVNLPNFTVQAQRADNSVDTEYTGDLIVGASPAGALLGASFVTFSNGEAVVTGLKFNTANTYQFTVSSGALAPATSANIVIKDLPGNDLCAASTGLTVNAAATNGHLLGATLTAPFSGADQVDVWYKFTVTQAADYTITVAGFTGDIDFDLFSKECPTSTTDSFIISSSATTAPEVLTRALTAGTYYIRVFSYNAAAKTSSFNISVTSPGKLSSNGISALNFGTVNKGSVSASQPVNVSGYFLAANAVVTVTAPTHYELSATGNANDFHATLNLTADANGSLAATPIYIRFNTTNVCGATTGNVSIASTGVTAVAIAVTATATVPATTASAGTAITANGFTASWTPVANATSYKVNVYKKTGGVTTLSEGFEGDVFPPAGWIVTDWSKSTVAADVHGGVAAANANINTGTLTTKLITRPKSMSFYLGRSANTTAKTLNVEISTTSQTAGFTILAAYDHTSVPSGSYNQYTVDLSTYSTAPIVYIRFVKVSSTTSPWRLDDVVINYNSFVETPVSGSPFTVTAPTISQVVIGLDPATEYFYNVEALVGTCSSVKSNEIAVTTHHDTTTYNGTVPNDWDYGAPDETVKAVINGNYTATTHLTAKTLTINSGNTLTIAKNYSFTTGDFTNHGSLTVENDGNFVQTAGSTNTGDGLATVKRIANIKRLDYVYWSSPVAAQKLKAFSPGTLNERFLTYNEWNDEFTPVPDPAATDFQAAKGYAIRARNNQSSPNPTDWLGQFVGKPHNGNQMFSLAFSINGYNMVGNPYPSNIKLDGIAGLLNHNTSVIEGVAYFWNNIYANPASQGSSYNGENYAIFNLSGGTPQGSSTVKPDGIVKVGQGFLVKAKSTANGKDMVITNDMRVELAGVSVFYDKKADGAKDRFWLQLTAPDQNFSTQLVAYVPHATNDYEMSYDAPLMKMSSDAFFSVLGDRQLGIQGRQYPLDQEDVVALGTNHFVAGDYVITLQEAEGIFATEQNVYLRDKLTGTLTNLSEGSYTFTANEGVTEGRFEITYKNDVVLGTGNSGKDPLTVYKDSGDFVVKSAGKKISEVQVYDASGRLVAKLSPNHTEVRIDGNAMISGVYVLKINRNGEITTKKVTK